MKTVQDQKNIDDIVLAEVKEYSRQRFMEDSSPQAVLDKFIDYANLMRRYIRTKGGADKLHFECDVYSTVCREGNKIQKYNTTVFEFTVDHKVDD